MKNVAGGDETIEDMGIGSNKEKRFLNMPGQVCIVCLKNDKDINMHL